MMMLNQPLQENTTDVSGSAQFLTFRVQAEEYGIAIEHVREIKVYSEITRLPNAADYLRGVMNLRGIIVPVFDVSVRFHGKATEVTAKHVVVILSEGNDTIGLLVDAVSDIIDARNDEIKALPVEENTGNSRFLSGLISRNERMTVLLNTTEIFALSRAGINTQTTLAQ